MRARRGRGARVGALLIAWMVGGASASGCDWVLGIDQVEVGCYGGEKRCDGQRPQTCDEQGQWVSHDPCENATCINGRCQGVCEPGQRACDGHKRIVCDADGAWGAPEACSDQACVDGVCVGQCEPNKKRCSAINMKMKQECNEFGQWENVQECPYICENGVCTCKKGERQCYNNTPQECDENGVWKDVLPGACVGMTCLNDSGTCGGECEEGKKRCNDNMLQACDENGQWAAPQECPGGQSCQAGYCVVECSPGDLRCHDNTRQECNVSGVWQDVEDCDSSRVCYLGECLDCVPGEVGCNVNANTPQICDVVGQWVDQGPCSSDRTCVAGACVGVCGPLQTSCSGNTRQTCDVNGQWEDDPQGGCPIDRTCIAGACVGVCGPSQSTCIDNVPQSCNANGQWNAGPGCTPPMDLCAGGACSAMPPSCAGQSKTCGSNGDESCCARSQILGGTYDRGNDPAYPATVSSFSLDRFEITVGRFRNFVAAYPGSKPAAGAGAHPLIPGTGWDAAWDAFLPADHATLIASVKCSSIYQTWTDVPGVDENLPMNCITWYEAFAFCAWDGGRLPTEAEWNHAAAGGSEQRVYPWSVPAGSTAIDMTYAVYDCMGDGFPGCAFSDIGFVGSRSPKGDGLWDQADLAGSLWEWNLDWYDAQYQMPCNDCANFQPGSGRVVRGGGWGNIAAVLLSAHRFNYGPSARGSGIGARCARQP